MTSLVTADEHSSHQRQTAGVYLQPVWAPVALDGCREDSASLPEVLVENLEWKEETRPASVGRNLAETEEGETMSLFRDLYRDLFGPATPQPPQGKFASNPCQFAGQDHKFVPVSEVHWKTTGSSAPYHHELFFRQTMICQRCGQSV